MDPIDSKNWPGNLLSQGSWAWNEGLGVCFERRVDRGFRVSTFASFKLFSIPFSWGLFVLGKVGFQVQALQITPCGLGAKAPSHPGSQLPQSLHNFCSQVVLITSRLLGTFCVCILNCVITSCGLLGCATFAFTLHCLYPLQGEVCGLSSISLQFGL